MTAAARRRRRAVISNPPARMTAYAAIIQPFSGAHQKSSGSTRPLPSTMNAMTSPMFDGLNTMGAAIPDDVLRQEGEGGDPGEHIPRVGAPRVARRRPGNTKDERDAAAGQHRAGRPHEGPARSEGQGHLEDRAGQDRREDLRDADLEAQPDLPEDVDRDDDGSDVQSGITGVRQDHGVRTPAERERPVGHIAPRSGLIGRPHSRTATV